jgi:hypothetical protein
VALIEASAMVHVSGKRPIDRIAQGDDEPAVGKQRLDPGGHFGMVR